MGSRLTNESQIEQWLKLDASRMEAVYLAAKLDLPQWLLSAGFLRDLVWDRLHDQLTLQSTQQLAHKSIHQPTNQSRLQLSDIDLIYFDPDDISEVQEKNYEDQLKRWAPHLPWSVKNQARMHIRNQDEPYKSCEHAMSFWPECETAIGVHFDECGEQFSWVAPFGLESLFELKLTHNNKRDISLFNTRVRQKSWLTRYPNLSLT